MKFIGQYIQSFIARFRNDVYLENVASGTIASSSNIGLDSNNKIVKSNTLTSLTVDDITLDGKTIGIIGDTNDTFTIVTGASGETTFTTDDAAGVNGNMVFSPDGIVTFNSSKLNIDSSGTNSPELAITNDATTLQDLLLDL